MDENVTCQLTGLLPYMEYTVTLKVCSSEQTTTAASNFLVDESCEDMGMRTYTTLLEGEPTSISLRLHYSLHN